MALEERAVSLVRLLTPLIDLDQHLLRSSSYAVNATGAIEAPGPYKEPALPPLTFVWRLSALPEISLEHTTKYMRYCPAEHRADPGGRLKAQLMSALLDGGARDWRALCEPAAKLSKFRTGFDSGQSTVFRLSGEYDKELRCFMLRRWWCQKSIALLLEVRRGQHSVSRLPGEVWHRILLEALELTLKDCVSNENWQQIVVEETNKLI